MTSATRRKLARRGGRSRRLRVDPSILGLAVPGSPAQALDLGDDFGLCVQLAWLVHGQGVRYLRGVLQAHGEMEPVCDGWTRNLG